MSGAEHAPSWHDAEFERIVRALGGHASVHAVLATGSFAAGTHDGISDLDLTVVGLDPAEEQVVLDLFDADRVLGRERYVGADRALYRVLLWDGRQYDVKVLRTEAAADADAPKVPVDGTDEFWFALHAALHAVARGRDVVALDLVLLSYRAVIGAYWSAREDAQADIQEGLRALELRAGRGSLQRAIAHVAGLAAHAFDDADRSVAFASILAERLRP